MEKSTQHTTTTKNAKPSFQLDFVGIGAPKAGTTQIAELLAAHPDLCLSEPKEIHYFNERMAYIHPPGNKNHEKDLTWYAKHFEHCRTNSLKGEFSTGYMYDVAAAENIKRLYPNIKIIACLRHPAERAYSQYVMFRYYFQKENREFDKLIYEQDEFVEKSLYYKQLKRYFDIFPKEQILVLTLGEIKKSQKETIQKVYNFLGVDADFIPPNLGKKANAAKASKFTFISTLMGWFAALMVTLRLSKVLHFLKEKGLKRLVMRLNSSKIDYPPMSPESRAFILEKTTPDVVKLEELLGRDFGEWKV